ncbi:YadA-like family protein [Brucella melitensis]|uniref:YadA-like family protein n=1 Tax=Brucella melitensis TaxID=29459 RepID=UPI000C70ED67|nr:YadA-like family protein [Brucella melitensis]
MSFFKKNISITAMGGLMLSLAVDAAKAEENVSQVKLPPVFVFELVENQGLANIALIRPRVIAPDNNLRPGGIVSGIAGLLTLGQENRNLISENRQVINNNTTAIGQNRTSISTNAKGVASNRAAIRQNSAAISALGQRVDGLQGQINSARKEARAGAANAAALSGLRYDNRPGKVSIATGVGGFKGSTALAAGIGYTSKNENARYNVSVAYNEAGTSWNAGASFTLN